MYDESFSLWSMDVHACVCVDVIWGEANWVFVDVFLWMLSGTQLSPFDQAVKYFFELI